MIKKAPSERITFAVRDRPFERTITMQKDSSNHVGFSYNNGKIKAIIKDSSAARWVTLLLASYVVVVPSCDGQLQMLCLMAALRISTLKGSTACMIVKASLNWGGN